MSQKKLLYIAVSMFLLICILGGCVQKPQKSVDGIPSDYELAKNEKEGNEMENVNQIISNKDISSGSDDVELLAKDIEKGELVNLSNSDVVLPEHILIDKKDFDTISDVITKYEELDSNNIQYLYRVNGKKRIKKISFINFKDKPIEIEDSRTFDIPEEIARILRFFGDIRFKGEIAKDMQLTLIDPEGRTFDWKIGGYWNEGLPVTYTKTGWHTASDIGLLHPLNMKDENEEIKYDGWKMTIKGNGTLKEVYLWEEEGLKNEYDITGYTIIGGDKPWLKNIKITVDATKNLSINGENKLDETKFKRYHVNSGPINLGSSNTSLTLLDKAYHMITRDYGFLPGRGAFHFTGLVQYSGMREDKDRPGYADYEVFDIYYQKKEELAEKLDTLFPTVGKDYVVTMDGWPIWQKVDPEVKDNMTAAAPAIDKFDAAAELAGKLVKAIETKFDGLGPKYIEVKNESTIQMEWPYMVTDPENAWDYLAEFHNMVADKIKNESPNTLVGGPSSAFMYLEKRNFDEARKQLKFMDDTKEKLDFYSHHFYENGPMLINDRENNPDGFLCGRLEAVFDLLNNHMVLTDNVKPILITEEGTYNNGGTVIDYWKKLRTYNGYMLRFINLTDSIGMITPYLYPIIDWRPNSNDTFYKYNETQTALAGTTPMIYYLDMWKDYRGAFIPVRTNNERIFTNAVRYGNKIFIAVQNMNTQRAYIDLDINTGDAEIVNIKRKHTYLELGKLVHEEVKVEDINRVPMRVEEITVFEITLNKEPEFTNTLLRKPYYGDKVLQETGDTPAEFKISCSTDKLERSVLRVSFGKSNSGFKEDMVVKVNGKEFVKDLEFTNKPGDFFSYVEFEIDKKIIKPENNITVSIPEKGAFL